jgi:hypothetical protein
LREYRQLVATIGDDPQRAALGKLEADDLAGQFAEQVEEPAEPHHRLTCSGGLGIDDIDDVSRLPRQADAEPPRGGLS